MTPIHELLSRIRHDRGFGRGQFEIGYLDRIEGTIRRVALKEIVFPAGERRVFGLVDETGQLRRIPFHRVREVYRDGQIIWQRPSLEPPDRPQTASRTRSVRAP
jgi:uncharacterized protein (UPF0248 family)